MESAPAGVPIDNLLRQWSVHEKGIRIEAFTSTVLTVLKLKFYIPPAKYGYILPPFELDLLLPLPDKVNVMLPGRHAVMRFSRFNEVCLFLHEKSLMISESKREVQRMSSVFSWLWHNHKTSDMEVTIFRRYQKNENKVYTVTAASCIVEDEAFILLRYHRFCCAKSETKALEHCCSSSRE